MLFNSVEFIFIFLPVTLTVFFLIGAKGHHRVAMAWLVGASLFFYGWWNPAYVSLILGSILFNYATGVALSTDRRSGADRARKTILVLGICGNLCLLGYYKYANFFVENINTLAGTSYQLENIVLPLAISFFTFQQITYLVDSYQYQTREYNFLHYCLFVTFFPQLIAGPIVHHKEMLPQFARDAIYKVNVENLAVGISFFAMGLFKKIVLADSIAQFATPVFDAAASGITVNLFEAWGAALAYTFQLYFDFSGYSDMAIGLGRLFGIRLPLNFNSPYKATNIIDFWRRWHMTLSRFLRDYLYIPLGGNRKGLGRRYSNIVITMLLGGLWHGAGWTFVIWGGLHAVYLVVNHFFHAVKRFIPGIKSQPSRSGRLTSWLLTFIAVVIAWVFFRAADLDTALSMLASMAGLNGIALPPHLVVMLPASVSAVLTQIGITLDATYVIYIREWVVHGLGWLFICFIIATIVPNTQEYFHRYQPAIDQTVAKYSPLIVRIAWDTRFWHSAFVATVILITVMNATAITEFLYFQF